MKLIPTPKNRNYTFKNHAKKIMKSVSVASHDQWLTISSNSLPVASQ